MMLPSSSVASEKKLDRNLFFIRLPTAPEVDLAVLKPGRRRKPYGT
jgi:hypothetical protein